MLISLRKVSASFEKTLIVVVCFFLKCVVKSKIYLFIFICFVFHQFSCAFVLVLRVKNRLFYSCLNWCKSVCTFSYLALTCLALSLTFLCFLTRSGLPSSQQTQWHPDGGAHRAQPSRCDRREGWDGGRLVLFWFHWLNFYCASKLGLEALSLFHTHSITSLKLFFSKFKSSLMVNSCGKFAFLITLPNPVCFTCYQG